MWRGELLSFDGCYQRSNGGVHRTSAGSGNGAAVHGNTFSDVNASMPGGTTYCGYIEDFATRGVTLGCGGGQYCPSLTVTRDQMAVFLGRAFLGLQ